MVWGSEQKIKAKQSQPRHRNELLLLLARRAAAEQQGAKWEGGHPVSFSPPLNGPPGTAGKAEIRSAEAQPQLHKAQPRSASAAETVNS